MPIRPISQKIRLSLVIAKLPLCFLVAFSALFGHIFAQQHVDGSSLQLFLAVLLLACGGASLNSYQERFTDKLMKRTQSRPLVTRIVSEKHAILQASLLLSAGLIGILATSNGKAFLAGVFGIAVYNLVYTWLKTKSLYAIIPGAICGAIPPYIGWLAADGEPVSFKAALLFSLLIFWQVPHFFLVMLNHRSDYYQSISPNILKYLHEKALHRIFMPWVTALSATMLTFTIVSSPLHSSGRYFILGNTVVLFVLFSYQLFFKKKPNYRILFRILNMSLFVFMAIICYGLS